MKRSIATVFIGLFLIGCTSVFAQNGQPTLLLFDTDKREGISIAQASSTTKALRNYFNDTRRVQSATFDRSSPTVLRAIMEHQLTADNVAAYSSREQRLEVAKVLGFQYAAGAQISVLNGVVEIDLWIAQVDGGKKAVWEAVRKATAGGASDNALGNAIQSAASAAVIEIDSTAFAQLPRTIAPDAGGSESTTAITPPEDVSVPVDYVASAEASIQAGDLASAIGFLEKAVNASPKNAGLRLKLADAYAGKGLYDEASEQVNRAAKLGADKTVCDKMRVRIADMSGGPAIPLSPTPASPGAPSKDGEGTHAVDTASGNYASSLAAADRLLHAGRYDQAAKAYSDYIKLVPNNPMGYERMAISLAWAQKWDQSGTVLARLSVIDPNPSSQALADRYRYLTAAFDGNLKARLDRYGSDYTEYALHKTSRETYYASVKEVMNLCDAMSSFLDNVPTPTASKNASIHRNLACGLLAQAASNMLDYLETGDNATAKANSDRFISRARDELSKAK